MTDRFVYVVFCHHRPELVLRLAGRIRALSPSAVILLRHDRGKGFLDAAAVAAVGATELHSTIRMAWASWAMVDGMVEAFGVAMEHGDRVVAVSGQDYPVADLAAWERAVVADGSNALVDAVVDPVWTERYSYRFRFVQVSRLPGLVQKGLLFVWYRLLARLQKRFLLYVLPPGLGWALGTRDRSAPFSDAQPCWKGAQWMTLDRAAVAAVTADHPHGPLATYYRTSYVPDESYLQTLLHRSGLLVRTAPTSWVVFDSNDEGHPRMLSAAQVHQARAAGAAFSRKADDRVDAGALDLADALTSADAAA